MKKITQSSRIFENVNDSFTSQKIGLERDVIAAISLAELIEYINEHEKNVNPIVNPHYQLTVQNHARKSRNLKFQN